MRHLQALLVGGVAAFFAFIVWAGATATECTTQDGSDYECVNQWSGEAVDGPGFVTEIIYPLGEPLEP